MALSCRHMRDADPAEHPSVLPPPLSTFSSSLFPSGGIAHAVSILEAQTTLEIWIIIQMPPPTAADTHHR